MSDRRGLFEQHSVAVPGPEMEQWLALAVARRLGLTAQIEFVLPARLIWNLLQQIWPSAPHQSPFDRDRLTMRLLELFISRRDELTPEVLSYVENRSEPALLAFAQRLALQFDRYLVYRPEWILDWESGKAPHWQAALWQQLALADQPAHWARVVTSEEILAGLARRPVADGPIYFFAPTPLSPGYLRLLKAVSGAVPVIFLLHNPCAAYWGDIADRKLISRVAVAQPEALPYYEQGNRLLASLGGYLRGFLTQLQELVDVDDEQFKPPLPTTLLGRLQADILQLQQPGVGSPDSSKPLARGDNSLQIHCCHSRLREVEVLQDQLLDLLASNAGLREHEIGVYVPDMEAYGPLVHAVFGSAPEHRRIAFNLSQPGFGGPALFEQLLNLLDALQGRVGAESVAVLLDIPSLRRQFGLDASDVDVLRRWIGNSGARWGLNDVHVEAFDSVAHHNTWEWARNRLMGAYGLAASRSEAFAGIAVPLELEGGEAEAVGGLLSLLEVLGDLHQQSTAPRSPQRWAQWVRRAAGLVLQPDEVEQWELQGLYDALALIQEDAAIAGLDAELGWPLFSSILRRGMGSGSGSGLLSRGVSFMPIRPGSVLPFKVICMLGLNDGEFPVVEEQWDIDLTRGNRRIGDRSARAESGLQFLELLTRAESIVRLTYVGRDQRTDDQLPPAPCLTELIEYLSDDAAVNPSDFHFVHPLQPFSGKYDGGTLFTYETFPQDAAQTLLAFVQDPLPIVADTPLELTDLISFFQHPARFLLNRKLGMLLAASRQELLEVEPFAVDSLVRWALRSDLLSLGLSGQTRETLEQHLLLNPDVPSGPLGLGLAGGLIEESASLAERSGQWVTGPGEPIAVSLDLGIGLQGVLEGYSEAGRIELRPGRMKITHVLTKWIEHLVFNLVAPAGFEKVTGWMTIEDFKPGWQWGPVADAAAHLVDLMALFESHQATPLIFAPETSFALQEAALKGKDDPTGIARARWRSKMPAPWEEGADPYYRLLLGPDPLLEPRTRSRLIDTAERVFGPMIRHRQDLGS